MGSGDLGSLQLAENDLLQAAKTDLERVKSHFRLSPKSYLSPKKTKTQENNRKSLS